MIEDRLETSCLDGTLELLASIDGRGESEADQVDLLAELERVKGAAAAAQARVTTTLAESRSAREAAAGVPAAKRCRGLASEIGLAKRTSPHRGARDLGLSRVLVHDMPATLGLLAAGEISEWRATLVVREVVVLTPEQRSVVDAELHGKLAAMGDREAAAAARRISYRLDPGAALRRSRGAASDRHVALRPAPDTMSYLTGFLPVAQGVACLAALRAHADTRAAEGDPRSRSQVMADTLVERVTGQASAEGVDVEIGLVMTEGSLLSDDDTPAEVVGYGPIPASVGRRIVLDAHRAWLRRLYRSPRTGSLVAMDSRRRPFAGELRHLLVLRDQICRTPWCDAPVRHADHVEPHARGGETEIENGQGLCEACNYAKEAVGWRAMRLPAERHEVLLTTPTGHTYVSVEPDLVGERPTWARRAASRARGRRRPLLLGAAISGRGAAPADRLKPPWVRMDTCHHVNDVRR